MSSSTGFPHQRLDAYRVALELAEGVVRLTSEMPRGTSDLRSQLQRSALATVRHIAEGASRVGPADKRARFTVARGEVAECDASLETVAALRLVPRTEVEILRKLADRIGAMLTGLIRREGRRMAVSGRPRARGYSSGKAASKVARST